MNFTSMLTFIKDKNDKANQYKIIKNSIVSYKIEKVTVRCKFICKIFDMLSFLTREKK